MNSSQNPDFGGVKPNPESVSVPTEEPGVGEIRKPETGDTSVEKTPTGEATQPEVVVEIPAQSAQIKSENPDQGQGIEDKKIAISASEINTPIVSSQQAAKLTEDINKIGQ